MLNQITEPVQASERGPPARLELVALQTGRAGGRRSKPTRLVVCISVPVLALLGFLSLLSPARAFTSADADASFASYNAAFYFTNGTNGFYRETTAGGKTWFWERAEQMEMVLDVYERTTNVACLTMFSNLFNGFIADHGSTWGKNDFNDDIMWMVIACSRAHQITDNPAYRDAAKNNFDMCFARAWSTNLGGGLWWKISNQSKNACVNGPAAIAAHLLFQITGDPNYLATAEKIFQWERANLFNPASGQVYDNIGASGKVDQRSFSYNQGTFVGAANFLGHTNDARLAADYAMNELSHDGLLPGYRDKGDASGFNGICARWVARFAKEHGWQSRYQTWLQTNAEVAWKNRRVSDNLAWSRWPQPTPPGLLPSWACSSVVVLLQVAGANELNQTNSAASFRAEKRYLNLPVKNGAAKRTLRLDVDGKVERTFSIELADAEPDWWAFMDVSAFKGRQMVLRGENLPENFTGLKRVEQSDEIKEAKNFYHEALRPQLHFSARRGWVNDPNGLVYFQGEYHLFFQHDPYSWGSDYQHWGHAVSRDLVHWSEQPEALYPDSLGKMWSGSAVVDWKNSSGFGTNGQPPIVMAYTAAGEVFGQCLAYSADGGVTFQKFSGNPVVKQITGGNRDPKLFWHEATRSWVMALWVEQERRNTVQFLTSTNLKDWTRAGTADDFFECPDFFELPVDGNPANKKWVLTAANSDYKLGSFDGKSFTAETPKLPGQRGEGFYAAQTFNDLPAGDGRRIQIGWLQAPSPGMPFNQCLSLPLELKLISTPDGVRLTRQPVSELTHLRNKTFDAGTLVLKPGDANPLAKAHGELLELRAEFELGADSEINFLVRGILISYDARQKELIVNGHRAPAPLREGKQRLTIYVDRTAVEVFASDGLAYVPLPVIPKANVLGIEASVTGAPVKFSKLAAYELRSIWK